MRTGTPPRLDSNSINYSNLTPQPSENPPEPFSYINNKVSISPEKLITCYLTRTTEEVLYIFNIYIF